MDSSPNIIPTERDLTEQERQLLGWLLDHAESDSSLYSAQLIDARVVSVCGCGCPTIDLGIRGAPAPKSGSSILADYYGMSPEDLLVGVIVHARDGFLSELEVYDVKGEAKGPFSLPTLDSLTLTPT